MVRNGDNSFYVVNSPYYSRLWNKHSPWNNRSPPLRNFHIMILTLFYINLGIAVIFEKFSVYLFVFFVCVFF